MRGKRGGNFVCTNINDGRCYGAAARILHSIVADVNRWSNPMQKLNDLSRSLTALEPDGTLIAVIEMSLFELARCWYRAWHRAPAVEKARGRRERIAEAAASMARGSGESRTQDRAHCSRL